MPLISTTYRRLIQVGKVSGAVSFLFAAPYALVKYIQAQDAGRVEQTLNMFKEYNSAPFTDYRGKITKALVKNNDQIVQASADEKSLLAEQLEIIDKEDIETELVLLFDFFDGVASCVKNHICDDETAVNLFKPRAMDIYLNFYQYMMLRRTTTATPDFGSGLQAVAKSGKASPAAAKSSPAAAK